MRYAKKKQNSNLMQIIPGVGFDRDRARTARIAFEWGMEAELAGAKQIRRQALRRHGCLSVGSREVRGTFQLAIDMTLYDRVNSFWYGSAYSASYLTPSAAWSRAHPARIPSPSSIGS
jgi:hypothetical protein